MIHGLRHAPSGGDAGNAHEHGLVGDAYHGLDEAQVRAIKAKGGGGGSVGGQFKPNGERHSKGTKVAKPLPGATPKSASPSAPPKHTPTPGGHTGAVKMPPGGLNPTAIRAAPKIEAPKASQLAKGGHLGSQTPTPKTMPKMPKAPSADQVKQAQAKQTKQGEKNTAAGVKRVNDAQKKAASEAKKTAGPAHKPASAEKTVKKVLGEVGHIEHAGAKKAGVLGEALKLGKEAVASVGGGEEVASAVKQKGGHK